MVEVSEKFRQLATDNGRHVYCRIEAGDEVFLDDRLLEFTFDDVTHPDWFTIGTACANRFHFAARFDGEIASGAVVRPYISFDNEEWCPLGTFYISRRYVRGSVIKVTAYDRMYSLDTPFSSALSLPCTSAALLEEICAAEGIELPDSGYPHKVTALPQDCTVRDMIGFIAGLNRACAKFDRSGRLLLKKCNENTQHISYLNCMDIQRNMGQSKVNCLVAQTDTETLVSGEGAKTDTVEMYNPLMTQDILDEMYSMLKPFAFYGADIEMQGLPYLESGESIALLDGKLLYRIVISEMELHYDGGLTGVIYSRNKTLVDEPVYMDDLEAALKRLSAAAFRLTNDSQLAISAQPVTIAEFTFDGQQGGFAQLDANISASESTADFAAFKIYLNGTEVKRSIVHNMEQDTGRHLLHIDHLETALLQGQNTLHITAQTGNGDFYILPQAMQASLVVHGGSSDGEGGGAVTGGAALYNYAMLSDTSARCNGVTYDIEKDGTTGLINRISDSLGNVLVPEISDGVTDAATHNAVFWAVAMAKGIRTAAAKVLPLFNYGGIKGFNAAYSDYYYATADGLQHNSMGDGDPDTSSISDDMISLKHLYYNGAYRHKWFALSTPIDNTYSKLRITAEVSCAVPNYNVAHVYVGRTFDPSVMGQLRHYGGIDDIVADYYFTNYESTSSLPQSVAKTTVDLDISGCIGQRIYIGFHHCCNDFTIHSIALV